MFREIFKMVEKKKTTAALIGTGHFGIAVIAQSLVTPELDIVAIADKNIDAIRNAAEKSGFGSDALVYANSVQEAKDAISEGRKVALTDPDILFSLDIDTIVEGTGNPEAGARHALKAIESGKNIVMVSKETDSVVGPYLRYLADRKGVVCTPVDGDQHGALMQLVEWARLIGLEVVAAGKSRDAEFIYDRKNKKVILYSDGGITIKETKEVKLSDDECALMEELGNDVEKTLSLRKKILSSLDERGGFDLCEMVIAANSTGLKPDVPALHDAVLKTSEIPSALCVKDEGGILSSRGVIEVVTNIHEVNEAGLGGGVFVVVHAENPYSQMILNTKGCISNPEGTVALVYKPYHLCGVEAGTTLLAAGLSGMITGSERYSQDYDIVQEAAVDLKKGDVMGNDHDERLHTLMVKATRRAPSSAIPAHMLSGRKLKCDVKKGEVITYSMVEEPVDSTLWRLRALQEEMK